jgi:DNA mismatch repair protein MutS
LVIEAHTLAESDMSDPRDTPAMRQFSRFKKAHPGCVLLFRIGDFYETFDDDAVTISRALGLTLTRRTEGLPMAGVPHHQIETYLRRLIEQGFRVAVCDQVQEAKDAKGLIERAVTRVLSPGTLVDESLLDERSPGCLAAVACVGIGTGQRLGLAVVEASTGAFSVVEIGVAQLVDELTRRGVTELLYSEQAGGLIAGSGGESTTGTGPAGGGATGAASASGHGLAAAITTAVKALGLSTTERPAWHFRQAEAREILLKQFGVGSLAGFGLSDDEPVVLAAGAVVRYLLETQAPRHAENAGAHAGNEASGGRALAHLHPPRRDQAGDACVLDAVTLRALEIERTLRPTAGMNAAGGVGGGLGVGKHGLAGDGSLLGVFLGAGGGSGAGCKTAMGKRLLREWLCKPLLDVEAIRGRHARVGVLAADRTLADELSLALGEVQDIARIAGRLALGRATPRDLVALGVSLKAAGRVRGSIADGGGGAAFEASAWALAALESSLGPVSEAILAACVESPPAHLREGGLIRDGVDAELDEARRLRLDATGWLSEYQARLIAEHDLPSIKVGFNSVFGYYIELPQAQSRRAPASFTRKQTLKNAERYITPELKTFEENVSTAESRSLERERAIFDELCTRCVGVLEAIGRCGAIVAELDVLLCFADRALRRGWVRPEMVDEPVLRLVGARHPVLEATLGDRFVPNDVSLGGPPRPTSDGAYERASLALITGPNMAGKSTFIRMAALVVILAQAGSFVPAEAATIGVVDRVFTRVGADDALHAGQSTFMVEMTETANILHHATPRSLVILDEIGRGTSTLDGLSLAWAIAEWLSAGQAQESGPRTLFATHYHELTRLQELVPGRVQNLHVLVREWPPGDPEAQLVFLHRIDRGRADRSYGVHVARLAGVPAAVVARAQEVLSTLAVREERETPGAAKGPIATRPSALPDAPGSQNVPSASAPAIGVQMGLFTEYVSHPAVAALQELKLDTMTPMQAFDALRSLRAMVERK